MDRRRSTVPLNLVDLRQADLAVGLQKKLRLKRILMLIISELNEFVR